MKTQSGFGHFGHRDGPLPELPPSQAGEVQELAETPTITLTTKVALAALVLVGLIAVAHFVFRMPLPH